MDRKLLQRSYVVALMLCTTMAEGAMAAGHEDANGLSLKTIIPTEIDPSGLRIYYGQCHQGMLAFGSVIQGEKGKWEYSIPLGAGDGLKAYAYIQGYQIAWVVEPNLSVPWKPQFKRASTITIAGRLTNSKGRPLANETLSFSYFIDEHLEFFRLVGGGITGPSRLGETVTGKDGSFRIEVADMGRDPFVTAYSTWKARNVAPNRVSREISVRVEPPRNVRAEVRWQPEPERIPMSPRYDTPLTIRVLQRAHVYGRIGEQFRNANGIAGEVSLSASGVETHNMFWLEAEPIDRKMVDWLIPRYRGYNCRLKQD